MGRYARPVEGNLTVHRRGDPLHNGARGDGFETRFAGLAPTIRRVAGSERHLELPADGATGFWPSLTLAVVMRDPTQAWRISEILEADGLLVACVCAGIGTIEFTARRLSPDVVVIEDACIEGFDAEDAVRETRRQLPQSSIVVICRRGFGRQMSRYLELGADALILEQDVERSLAAIVRCAGSGQISVPRTMRHLVTPPALSHREKQVLELAADGLTNSEIASRLFLAESTVKTHLSSGFRRLGVRSRREAAALIHSADEDLRRQLLPFRTPSRKPARTP